MKLYTKSGDGGACGLFSGERVPKCHDRVNAFGEIDELNSALGFYAPFYPKKATAFSGKYASSRKIFLTSGRG